MTIGIRNASFAYNTYKTSEFMEEKIKGYVAIPIYGNDTVFEEFNDNYLEFYKDTVNKYDGILIETGNYEVELGSGKTLNELYDQDDITINHNYLLFNPIYDLEGKKILPDDLDNEFINVLIPKEKTNKKEKYLENIDSMYSKDVNFILYDSLKSEIYSYNADMSSGDNGKIPEPVVIVVNTEDIDSSYFISWCSQDSYFINPRSNNAYEELLPVLKENGIDKITIKTPNISSRFSENLSHWLSMLKIYVSQTIILSIGLISLIIFSANLYCKNYKDKIAYSLIEGYSLYQCLRKHIIVTIISYILSLIAVLGIGLILGGLMNYWIVLGAFILEIAISYIVCKRYTKANLVEIVKGAE